jgi:nitroreductase
MNFFDLIHTRRSIRAYAPRTVEPEKIDAIVAAANAAPSAGNLQAYEILVVRDAAARRDLVHAALGQEFLARVPVVLVFFAHPGRSATKYHQRGAVLYSVQDATIACAYAQLAATALGLGTVWVGAFDDAAVAKAVGAKPEWKPVAMLPIGYPAESPAATPRRSLSDLVTHHGG